MASNHVGHRTQPRSVEERRILITDLLRILKHHSLLCYHAQLDLAAYEFTQTADVQAFARNCVAICQGTVNFASCVEQARKHVFVARRDGEEKK